MEETVNEASSSKDTNLKPILNPHAIMLQVSTLLSPSVRKQLESVLFKPKSSQSLGLLGKLPFELLIIIAKNLDTMDQIRFIFNTHNSLRQLAMVSAIWENILIHEKPGRIICKSFASKMVPMLPRGCVRSLCIHSIGGRAHTYQPLNLLQELRRHDQTLSSLTLRGHQKTVHESLLAIILVDVTNLSNLLGKLKILVAQPVANTKRRMNIRPDQLITLLQLLPNLEVLILENQKNARQSLSKFDLYDDVLVATNLKTLVIEFISITLPIMYKFGSFFPALEKLHMGSIKDASVDPHDDCVEAGYHPLSGLIDFSATYSGTQSKEISRFFFELIEGSPEMQKLSFCCLNEGLWSLFYAAKVEKWAMKSPKLKEIRLGGWTIPDDDMDGEWFYEHIWQRPDIVPRWRGCCWRDQASS